MKTRYPGPRWGLMGRLLLDDVESGERYLSRLRIVVTPWGSLLLHRLGTPDNGRDLHDHPWWFACLVIKGGYEEIVASVDSPNVGQEMRRWRAGSVHTIRFDQCHTIWRLDRTPTWTLLVTGSIKRDWGFYTKEGRVAHEEYQNRGVRSAGSSRVWGRWK